MMSAAFDAEEEMAMDHADDAGERTNEPQTEEGIQSVPARWAANTRIVDMPVLDFADDERLVMHAYFGLFIYNLSTGEIEDSLDLQTLGEYDDSACEISVSQNADTIWIRTEASGSLYEYDRQEKKLAVIEDLRGKGRCCMAASEKQHIHGILFHFIKSQISRCGGPGIVIEVFGGKDLI